jgi:hypothetical protein
MGGELFTKLGDTFEYLQENVDAFENGDIELEDLPLQEVSDDAACVLVMKSIQFGLFWEREYPSTKFEILRDRLLHDLMLLAEHHPDRKDDLTAALDTVEDELKTRAQEGDTAE